MTSGSEEHTRTLERLSAVMDGEADDDAVLSACGGWREADGDRVAWYAWHLAGDVMRSDDLASNVNRDGDFLSAFRARLADEPVILAPAARPELAVEPQVAQALLSNVSGVRRRRSWTASAAVAAGFVVVAGAVVVLQRPAVQPVQVAQSAPPQPAAIVPVSTVVKPPAPAQPMTIAVSNGQMIRDARLQQYLAAHKQFGGATALGVPSGFLRSATVETTAR